MKTRPVSIAAITMLLLLGAAGSAQSSNPQRLFEEGVAAQQRGDNATAVRDYRELLHMHPEAVAVRVNLGATLADMKRFDEAIAQYRIVLAAEPKNRLARLNLALAYKENGSLPLATREAERLHREDAGDVQASMLLADCFSQAENYKEAVSLLLPLEAAHADDMDLQWLLGSALIRTGRTSQGVERVEKVAATNKDAGAYLLAGQARLSMNQFDLAKHDAEAAASLAPDLAGLKTLTGMIMEQTGDYDGAQSILQQSLIHDEVDFDAHFYLGAIYYFKRDLDNAKLQLERALQLQPRSAQARYELALVERAAGQSDAAVKDLESVVQESPNWVQPHVELSALYYRLRRSEDGAREREIVDRITTARSPDASPLMPRTGP